MEIEDIVCLERTGNMRVRNKEHQSLGIKELKQLVYDYPNDQQLGEEIRRIVNAAITNNPKGTTATSLNPQHFKPVYNPRQYTIFEED